MTDDPTKGDPDMSPHDVEGPRFSSSSPLYSLEYLAQLSTVSVLLFRPSYLVKTTRSEQNEKIELACVGTDRVVVLCLSGTTTL